MLAWLAGFRWLLAGLLRANFWVQGGWEVDEDLQSAAMRETVEEAGVRGVLEVSGVIVRISFGGFVCSIASVCLLEGLHGFCWEHSCRAA